MTVPVYILFFNRNVINVSPKEYDLNINKFYFVLANSTLSYSILVFKFRIRCADGTNKLENLFFSRIVSFFLLVLVRILNIFCAVIMNCCMSFILLVPIDCFFQKRH